MNSRWKLCGRHWSAIRWMQPSARFGSRWSKTCPPSSAKPTTGCTGRRNVRSAQRGPRFRRTVLDVEALEFQKQKDYIKANELFESILGYKNVDELIEKQKFDVERQRILTARLGDIVTLGRCNDGDLEIDGEIKWIVLAEENGKKLIVSENILAHKKYHQTLKGITWEASDLREWLNTNFYAKFFTEQEKILISENLLKNKNNSSNNIEAGNDTVDKIFVLSFYEANRYFASTEKRSMKDWWWLRTPGTQADRATIVTEGGYLLATGKDVDKIGGVRPAMWVG